MPSPWIVPLNRPAKPRATLYAFPHAGAGAAAFRLWPGDVGDELAIRAIQLPGRENRLAEPPLTDFAAVVSALLPELLAEARPPYLFFGHSLGALLAFEIAREFRAASHPLPDHLLVSGRKAPDIPEEPSDADWLGMPEPQLIARLKSMGGTPDAVFAHPDLLALVLPAVRADLTLVQTYHYQPGSPLPIPLTVLGGRHDSHTTPATLAGWERQTESRCTQRFFEGDHFFTISAREEVTALVLAAVG